MAGGCWSLLSVYGPSYRLINRTMSGMGAHMQSNLVIYPAWSKRLSPLLLGQPIGADHSLYSMPATIR